MLRGGLQPAGTGRRPSRACAYLEQTRDRTAPENSAASLDTLGLAKNQWIFFDSAVQQLRSNGADGKGPQNVATTSERIQEALAAVTAQYAQDISGAAGKSR